MADSYINPDLEIAANNMPNWNTPEHRREGFRNLYRVNRYGLTLRSDQVLKLEKNIDFRIGELPEVQALTASEIFCGMAVARGQELLFEKYAADFAPNQPHTIMSISKTTVNLIIGELLAAGKIDLSKKVREYLPEIGSGYADATLQQVMDMDVINHYSEDYCDPASTSFIQETALGWRLQGDNLNIGQREYLLTITGDGISNDTGHPDYKSANTDVIAWIAEIVGERPLRDWLIDITEAAGFEQAMYISTDRSGMPILDGGINLTLRDLTRYGLLFARLGAGVAGRQLGNAQFIRHSRARASLEYPESRKGIYYSNQLFTNKRWIGHAGWGGQFMLVNLETGIVCTFFSVLENSAAHDVDYSTAMIRMLDKVSEAF